MKPIQQAAEGAEFLSETGHKEGKNQYSKQPLFLSEKSRKLVIFDKKYLFALQHPGKSSLLWYHLHFLSVLFSITKKYLSFDVVGKQSETRLNMAAHMIVYILMIFK